MRSVILRPWDELIGVLSAIEANESQISIMTKECRVSFPLESAEGKIIRETLTGSEGRRVSILRTDLPRRPLLVRVVDETARTR